MPWVNQKILLRRSSTIVSTYIRTHFWRIMQCRFGLAALLILFSQLNVAKGQTNNNTSQQTAASVSNSNSGSAQNTHILGSCEPNGSCLFAFPLIVPFKVQLTKNQDVFGSVSLGMAPAWQPKTTWQPFNAPIALFAFAGYSAGFDTRTYNISPNGGHSAVNGISYGGGVMLRLGKISENSNVNGYFALVLGADHVSRSEGYLYNDKPWLSFTAALQF